MPRISVSQLVYEALQTRVAASGWTDNEVILAAVGALDQTPHMPDELEVVRNYATENMERMRSIAAEQTQLSNRLDALLERAGITVASHEPATTVETVERRAARVRPLAEVAGLARSRRRLKQKAEPNRGRCGSGEETRKSCWDWLKHPGV
jgi:hypothetical protein